MNQIDELADRYVAYRKHTEHEAALWTADMTHLEAWDDVSMGGRELRASSLVAMADEAETLAAAETDLERRQRNLLETIEFGARSEAIGARWREPLRWVNHTIGIIPMILTFLPRYQLRTPEDGQRYIEKIHRMGPFLDAWRATLVEGRDIGVVPIRHHVAEVVAMVDRLLDGQMSSSPLAFQAPPVDMSEPMRTAWREQLLLLLDTTVAPALKRVADTLRTITLDAARPDDQPGLCHLAGGGTHYEQSVWASTSTGRTPEEVHRIGLEQVARLEEEYRDIGSGALGVGDVPTLFRRLRDDPELHYQSADALIADATAALARATEAASGWFGRLPVTPCAAMAIDQGPLAFYSRPLQDGSKDGTFFFNTAVPEVWGTFQLEATTFHEGVPGHHLQLALAIENVDLHDVHREFGIPAYNEGWGLYTERLADEMGLYSSDLDRLGMITADSMRACRLVVDTGIHALGWTRARAIDYMADNSPIDRRQIIGEIDRYIGLPGQAVSYMIGRLEIEDIRRQASERADFDLVEFHDAVLACGAVSLPTLRAAVLESTP